MSSSRIGFKDLQIKEGVLQIPAILIDLLNGKIFAEAVGVKPLDIEPQVVSHLQVSVMAPAPQVVAVLPRASGLQPVVLIHEAITQLAPGREHHVGVEEVELHPLELFPENVIRPRLSLVGKVIIEEDRFEGTGGW